jgi:hypothetical protein
MNAEMQWAVPRRSDGLDEMASKSVFMITALSAAVYVSSCSKSNNLLLGRVETKLGTHTIIVTDCYRTSVPPAQVEKDSVNGSTSYHFAPCLDADIVIRNEWPTVNRKAYERLSPGDTVIIDHGQVLVNSHLAQKIRDTFGNPLPALKENHDD